MTLPKGIRKATERSITTIREINTAAAAGENVQKVIRPGSDPGLYFGRQQDKQSDYNFGSQVRT
jgi:hypothetical protein